MPWQAEEAPDPRLLVLNEPLAAELGLDPAWLRSPDGLRLLVGNAVPDGATPVAQAYAGHQFGGYAPRLGDGRALLLGELARRRRRSCATCTSRAPGARRSPAAATAWPRSGRCCASTSSARRCTPWASRPPAPSPSWRRGARCSRETVAARRGARPGRQQPPARRQLPVRPGHRRRRPAAPARRPRDRPAPPRRRGGRAAATSRCSRRSSPPRRRWWPGGCSSGFVHGVMNTDNMTISGETIDYGPCAFMDALRPGHGLQLDRRGRALRLRQPAAGRGVEPRPARRGAAAAASTTTRSRRSRWRWRPSAGSARSTAPPGRPACGPSSACPTGSTTTVASPLVDELLALLQAGPRRLHVVLPRPRQGRPRRRRACARPGSSTWPAFDALGWSAGARWARTPTRWTGSTRSTSRATTWSRRRWPPRPTATWIRSARLLDAVTAPFDERPGLERYAAPAPEDFGAYRTFCGT